MTQLILALDLTDRSRALDVARACTPYIDAVKIGYPLVLKAGIGIARDLAGTGLPLIADFKVADIPNTNRLITEQVFSAGFTAVIAQGFCGRDAVEACVETAHEKGGECYVVAEMSHPGALEFFTTGVPERIASIAIAGGADGLIAPATRPDRVRALRAAFPRGKIFTPGIGTQGGDPASVSAYVDGIIVGRSIYDAPDPARAARDLSSIRR